MIFLSAANISIAKILVEQTHMQSTNKSVLPILNKITAKYLE
jgi:hypothetical protein